MTTPDKTDFTTLLGPTAEAVTNVHDYLLGQVVALRNQGQEDTVVREMALVVAMHRLGGGRLAFTLDDYIEAMAASPDSIGFAMSRLGHDAWAMEPSNPAEVARQNAAAVQATFSGPRPDDA